jgi:thioredoxin 1
MKILATILLVSVQLAAQGPVKWEHDLAAAQKRAKAEHKVIFVDVWTEWCGWCIKLQKDTFPAPEAAAALAGVVPLSLKTQLKDGSPTEHVYAEKRFGVEGFPCLLVIDAEGRVLGRNSGYLPPAKFAEFINRYKH